MLALLEGSFTCCQACIQGSPRSDPGHSTPPSLPEPAQPVPCAPALSGGEPPPRPCSRASPSVKASLSSSWPFGDLSVGGLQSCLSLSAAYVFVLCVTCFLFSFFFVGLCVSPPLRSLRGGSPVSDGPTPAPWCLSPAPPEFLLLFCVHSRCRVNTELLRV